jgi:shikimate dehydrogenase
VVGDGGGASATVYALAQRGAAEIVIVDRSPERAAALIARFAQYLPGLVLRADLEPRDAFALVVDAAPGAVGEMKFAPGGWAIDLKYGRMPSSFSARAKAAGLARAVDGPEMLVEQALATYEIWLRDGRPFTSDESARLMDGLLAHLEDTR